jgi:adenosylhomocysteinase
MNEKGEEIQARIENPFEKVRVEDLNDNYELIAYLFAKPKEAIYGKLIGRYDYRIVGGWGSGKSMLLKYISFESQVEVLKEKLRKVGVKEEEVKDQLRNEFKKIDFLGIYMKAGQGGFKPFLKPGGEFKNGGEILFGHYFNLLMVEKVLSLILYGMDKGIFNISPKEENDLTERILSKFSVKASEPQPFVEEVNLQSLKNKVASWKWELETFLNTRDLEKDLSYDTRLTVNPTSIKTFLNQVFQEIKNTINDLSQKRFYILLDECDLLSIGQQKVINTIIKQRHTTMVFKLASRPPDIKTMDTVEEGVGLTDREIKKLYLDEMYEPASKSYKDLCYNVAKKRLEKYCYPITDIRKILGKYTIEDEIGEDIIKSYLKKKYPNKQRIENKFKDVYKDFKVAAAFQILRKEKRKKKYAGFDTFVMLSSGIMLHFLELCRDTFTNAESEGYIIRDNDGNITFKQTPLPIEIQSETAYKVSEEFFRDVIKTRADSLKDTSIEMEFGGRIQHIVSILTGIFRHKLMTFNEPEAARIEIPEGIESLDNSIENPIKQLFETAIKISVFQEGKPYMPKSFGGVRPPTYISHRLLAPYPEMISPRPRWRTKISADTFNKILKTNPEDFKNEVLGRKKSQKKEIKEEIEKKKKERILPKEQLTLPLFSDISESMPVLGYLSNKINGNPFDGKTIIILLHLLKDLIPFMDSLKKLGAAPSTTFIFYKDYQYPNKEKIEQHFKKQGYGIYPLTELDAVLKNLELKRVNNMIVIEDGGHIVPELHKDFKNLANTTLGAVEQTTKGIRNDENIKNLLFPVISIPRSDLKNTFEPPHVARAVINNIQNLLRDINFSGKKGLVIGFGRIGEQVALQLRDTLKMQVSIYDSDTTKLVKAHQYGFATEENLEVGVKEKFIIVGATGETVIRRREILAMEHNVYLVSASSEQWEFCISELEALSSEKIDCQSNGKKVGTRYKIRNTEKYVNLIADGQPINFWKTESMPNEVSDLIMSLILVSAVEIATNSSLPRKINSDIVNELEKRYDLSRIYLEYHR